MQLSELKKGGFGIVREITGDREFRHRLLEMGFISGTKVEMLGKAPFGDPLKIRLKGYELAIRKKDARNVILQDYSYIKADYTVALVGNPNSGKTSIFNRLSGMHERVGNYSGVTISPKEALCTMDGCNFRIVDLPGTYSLSHYSPEEKEVLDYLQNNRPDVVINVVNAGNLERNLYLTLQLRELGFKTVVALNMYDELSRAGAGIDIDRFSSLYGVRAVPTVARTGKGLDALLKAVADYAGHENMDLRDSIYEGTDSMSEAEKESCIPERRYAYIESSMKEILTDGTAGDAGFTEKLDRILTNKYLGFPIFILFMWITFQTTFIVGEYPMMWIEEMFSWLSGIIAGILPDGFMKSLLVDGIIAGVGGVMVFLPNILILYFFISIMEDTGYMARAAYIMDRMMSGIGLNGKAFIPMIMGFGCNVPAVMATKTIEGRNNRILTMLVSPLISCSARLPVYLVLVGAFFPKRPGLIIVSVYLFGIILAGIMSVVFKRIFFKGNEIPFVIELPPYRIPTFISVIMNMWGRAKHYLAKMAGIILVASVIIWALGYFPNGRQEDSFIMKIGHFMEPAVEPLGFDWRVGVGLLSGMAAKELVVSTMSILYGADGEESLSTVLATGVDENNVPIFNSAIAISLIVFVLIYFPCIATVTAISRESGSWKWGAFVVLYTTSLAWLLSFMTFRIASVFV